MTPYDNYEISPCQRFEQPDKPGHFYFEVCEPHEADVWTLYGHLPEGGAEAIGDFDSREHAEQVFQRITGIPFGDHNTVAARVRLMHAAPNLQDALLDALPYVEDVLGSPEQLACFKKGVVQGHVKAIRAAIEATDATKGVAA